MKNSATYLSEIINALKNLGGSASLKEINQYIEKRDVLVSIRNNKNWTRNVSAVIQRHCNQTRSYTGGKNLFYSVYGIGEGFWGLVDYFDNAQTPEDNIENRICYNINNNNTLDNTEKEMLIKARKGQGIFRERIIQKYQKCILSGIEDNRLLIASHIKPWRSSNNIERLSSENGLLLSPLYDKLFDIGLITFNKNMNVIISNKLNNNDINKLSIETNISYIKSPSIELQKNMEYHRDIIFKR